MREIQNLLSQISTIIKKNNEYLDSFGGRFNMFSVVGVDHYETIHSAILAEFLNPSGSHGLKDSLLKAFIQEVGIEFNFNAGNAKVQTEAATDDGRIDILIDDNNGNAIVIENKIYAGDQPEQLIRYDKFLNKSNSNYRIIYLTLFGEKPSEQSSQGVAFIPISYSENIINWLEKCVSIAARFPTVRETIIQYINHLKQLTNQDMDTLNQKEIIDIIESNPDYVDTIIELNSIVLNLKNQYITKIFEVLQENIQKPVIEINGLKFSIEIQNDSSGFYYNFIGGNDKKKSIPFNDYKNEFFNFNLKRKSLVDINFEAKDTEWAICRKHFNNYPFKLESYPYRTLLLISSEEVLGELKNEIDNSIMAFISIMKDDTL